MKKFAAHFIFPISSPPIKKGIIKTDDTGKIIQLIDPGKNFQEESGLEFHNGIICPEFVSPSSFFYPEKFLNQFDFLSGPIPVSISDFQSTKTILDLIKRLQKENESAQLEMLVGVFTFEMAKFNLLESDLGSIEPDKRPGLLNISGVELKTMRLRQNCTLKKLI